MFKFNSLYRTDGYKLGHKEMLAPGTDYLYGTWVPRSLKHAPKGVEKIVSFGQQMAVRWLDDEFKENFFGETKSKAQQFIKDMSMYLGMDFNGGHFEELYELGYLPIKVKALPEGVEVPPNVPHMTFINTVPGFAWLTLYLETTISALCWKPTTSATIALMYRKNAQEWLDKTDRSSQGLVDFMCHDFSARGLSVWDMISSGIGHATSFRGSDTLPVIPAARYFYDEPEDEVCINSVNASEHSVSTTCIFTMGESEMLSYYMDKFPAGILSIVADTFDLWTLITKYLPENKEQIMSRDGKLVLRPDSGDPVDIICGAPCEFGDYYIRNYGEEGQTRHFPSENESKGVIELLWDIFGGTVNDRGYKVLDSHIGCIYGDSITLERQVEIYKRLEAKGFAATNIVLGIGSFTYQMNTRDTFGFAAKGSWFESNGVGYNIYKDPITDDGTKKSLKGKIKVEEDFSVVQECSSEEESGGMLQTIYENGKFSNQTSLTEVRKNLKECIG